MFSGIILLDITGWAVTLTCYISHSSKHRIKGRFRPLREHNLNHFRWDLVWLTMSGTPPHMTTFVGAAQRGWSGQICDLSNLGDCLYLIAVGRRQIGDRAFSIAAPWAWNRLLMKLKLLRSTDSFHRDLKTFLFKSVYGYGLTLWCTLGVLVGGTIQVP